MSYDDHDLCGSFCECGPEVTPMTATERAEYQAETARLRAANVARVQQDADNLRAYDKAVRDALQALRDTDHATAVLANIAYDTNTPAYVVQSALMMLRPDNDRADILNMDRGMALVEYRRALAGRRLDAPCEICGDQSTDQHTSRDHARAIYSAAHAEALEIDRTVYPLLRGLGEPHPAEPHSRRPTECRVCRRPIVGRFDDGKALSYTHRPKASL